MSTSFRYALIIKALYDYQHMHGVNARPATICMSRKFYQAMVRDVTLSESFDVLACTVAHIPISIDTTGLIVDFILFDKPHSSVP